MKTSQVEAFRKKMSSDSKLQEQYKNGTNLFDLAQSNGFTFSQAEFDAKLAEINSDDAELNDFELEMISAGSGDNAGAGVYGKP